MFRALRLAPLIGACTVDTAHTIDHRTLELEVTTETAVDLVTRSGSLDVIGEPDRTTVELSVQLVRFGAGPFSIRSDDDGLDALVVELQSSGDVIEARSLVDILGSDPFATDVVLRVPSGFDLIVDDTSGDIDIDGIGSLDLTDDSGSIDARGIAGDAVIADDSGDLLLEDVAGTVEIEDASGSIELRGAMSTTIVDDSGDILVEDIDGDVDIVDASGSIWVRHVTGTVRIDDDSGDIVLEDVGDYEILSDGSGGVRVD